MTHYKITKIILIICTIFTLSILAVKIKYNIPNNRVVGITEGFIEIPCAKPVPGRRCSAPDQSRIAFYVKAPDQAISYPPADRDYNNYIGIGLLVSDKTVESIYENKKRDGDSQNYLIGSHVDTVRISYSAENELDSQLQRLSLTPKAKYAEVTSDIEGYRKFDDTTCPSTGTTINKNSLPEEDYTRCTAMRRALYIPKHHPDTLISCMQIILSDNILKLHTCTITTKLSFEGRARYSIQPKHVLSGKWIELNERIVRYINSLLNPATKSA
ncbi:hypothetical protein [Aquipseudomonas alcaligenes]|uniref:Uncharacterized protein n=1 Tax=Aquipseudomonas alcaligenes TaxID=43263 RepID=A0AB73I248_AQUAC|nr:hypothetical protein [Pseudomonas alcaligenes]MDH0144137.1 hypothetical protein [Pseudomonas alcaligenes]